jgi:hypothetical protein
LNEKLAFIVTLQGDFFLYFGLLHSGERKLMSKEEALIIIVVVVIVIATTIAK